MKNYLIILIIILLGILIYCFLELNSQSEMIKIQNDKIQTLSPKFKGEDTLNLLKLVLNLKEFDKDTQLLDTASRVIIFLYPYLTKEYILYKYNKQVFVGAAGIHPYQNQFMFTGFKLINNDSADIDFMFNEYRVGILKAKKINDRWIVKDYILGRI